MNNSINYIQPTIVKLSDCEDIPVSLRNHYMININVVGIKYFQEYFVINESPAGEIIMKEDSDVEGWLLEQASSTEEIFDVPRVYVVITDDIVNDDSLLTEYISNGIINNEVLGNGIYNFRPGHEFYINATLYNYLVNNSLIEENADMVLPNYINNIGEITEYFEELTCDEKNYSNLEHYYKKNVLTENTFSEDDLNDFYATFAKTIVKYTEIDDVTANTTKNQIYALVLNYFANYKSDCASIALNLILNTPFSSSTSGTCGCQTNSCSSVTGTSTTISGNYNTTSCYDLYSNAMTSYLKTMLGDPEFYEDWFSITLPNGSTIPNDTLISALETLIHEFIGLNYDISNLGKKQKKFTCGCSNINTNYDYTQLINYLKVLNWVDTCQLDANINKTKIYGEAFGEILPYMQF